MENSLHTRKYKFLMVTALSAFIGTIDASIVNVSLPTMAREFNVSIDSVAWVVLAYSLSIAATLLLVGRIAVKKGFRTTFLIGFALFTVASCLCGMSETIWQLIVFRVLQGIGASFMMASGPALIIRTFPANERGKGMGILGTVVGTGLMLGPPLGGFIVSTLGWSWIFFINIPIGVFGFFYSNKLLQEIRPDSPKSRLDFFGAFLQAGAIICILIFLNRINSPDWPFFIRSLILAAGISFLTIFLIRETKTEHPLIGLAIFRHTQFTIAITAMTLTFIGSAAGMILIPFYLENILGLEPLQVGLLLITIPLCMGLTSPLAGRISDAIGYRLLTTFGIFIMAVGIIWMGTADQNCTRFDIVLRLILIGVGAGMFQAPNSSAMMSAIPKEISAIASSLLAIGRTIGLAIGVALATAVFAYQLQINQQTYESADAFVKSFSWVLTVFGAFCMIAVIISATRKNRISNKG